VTKEQIERIRKVADELFAIRKECDKKEIEVRDILGDMSDRLHVMARGYERMLA